MRQQAQGVEDYGSSNTTDVGIGAETMNLRVKPPPAASMGDPGPDDPNNWGKSSHAGSIHSERLMMRWWAFQKEIVFIFCGFLGALLLTDMMTLVLVSASNERVAAFVDEWPWFTNTVLPLVLPIFGFVLGRRLAQN